jgi:ubiquinone/menaquinone biosynthesis C-methylase UbiE
MTKHKIQERFQLWWAGLKAYTNPLFPLTLRQRELFFLRTAETICIYNERGIVLDVGTGSGRLPLLLAQVAPEIKCVCIDLNPVLLRNVQQISAERQINDRVLSILADVEALPIASLSVDLAVSIASFHQWHNRKEGIMELYRVLKKGGIILILVGARLMWLFDFFKGNLANSRNIKRLFETVGFKDVMTVRPESGSDFLLVFGRK